MVLVSNLNVKHAIDYANDNIKSESDRAIQDMTHITENEDSEE